MNRNATIEELKQLHPGRKRRGIHDDISVVVFQLGSDEQTD